MNIIAYKLPGDCVKHIYKAGKGQDSALNPTRDSFIISPFDCYQKSYIYTLETRLTKIPEDVVEKNHLVNSFRSLTRGEYGRYINYIKNFLEEDEDRKVVAARNVIQPIKIDPDEMFESLCSYYPDSFVFFVSTGEFGTWIGASPELLLKKSENELESISLAGTRKAGTQGEWDQKNLLEQKIVTRHIKTIFQKYGIEPKDAKSQTLRAGNIEHIMTPVRGTVSSPAEIEKLLRELSPTPALCGYPKDEASKIIERYEGNRSLYGGYCGPVWKNGDFRFNVVIRCAFLETSTKAILFAGGGITSLSDINNEWEETEHKLDTLRKVFESKEF